MSQVVGNSSDLPQPNGTMKAAFCDADAYFLCFFFIRRADFVRPRALSCVFRMQWLYPTQSTR